MSTQHNHMLNSFQFPLPVFFPFSLFSHASIYLVQLHLANTITPNRSECSIVNFNFGCSILLALGVPLVSRFTILPKSIYHTKMTPSKCKYCIEAIGGATSAVSEVGCVCYSLAWLYSTCSCLEHIFFNH